MKNLLLILCFVISITSFGQAQIKPLSKIDTVNKAISSFILEAKNDFGARRNNLVFIAKIFPDDTDVGVCLSIGYMYDSFEFEEFVFKYYLPIGNDTLLVLDDNNDIETIRKWFDLKLLIPQNMASFKSTLYAGDGFLTYHPPGLICCINNTKTGITYYDDESEIPHYKSVYGAYDIGVTVTERTGEEVDRDMALKEKMYRQMELNEKKELKEEKKTKKKCKLKGQKKK